MKAVGQARRALAAVMTLLMAAITFAAQEGARSVDEALRDLRRTQAEAADWEGFQPGSSVTYLKAGRSRIVGDYRERFTQVMTRRTPTAVGFDMVLEDGERNPWLPANTDVAQLASANAEKVGEEDVFIGRKKFHAVIYQFRYEKKFGRLYDRDYEQTYWLAPGVPDGVVRHHMKVVIDPTFTSESDMKITELNVELKAGTKTVRGYCFETEEGARGGKFTHGRMCKSREVPGALVTAEVTEMEGAQEKAHARQTIESFTAVR